MQKAVCITSWLRMPPEAAYDALADSDQLAQWMDLPRSGITYGEGWRPHRLSLTMDAPQQFQGCVAVVASIAALEDETLLTLEIAGDDPEAAAKWGWQLTAQVKLCLEPGPAAV
jgi:hypothetical protein